MSKDKQIDEMAKVFDTVMQRRCFHKSCNECEFDTYDTSCKATMLADALINDYGYRKASDVAREIFEEIKASSSSCVAECNGREIYGTKTYTIKATKLDEILKKYESEVEG